jgi:hypothetical protein
VQPPLRATLKLAVACRVWRGDESYTHAHTHTRTHTRTHTHAHIHTRARGTHTQAHTRTLVLQLVYKTYFGGCVQMQGHRNYQ